MWSLCMTSTGDAADSFPTLAVDRADVDNRSRMNYVDAGDRPITTSGIQPRRDANDVTHPGDVGRHCKLNS